jgi:hypothetical protein
LSGTFIRIRLAPAFAEIQSAANVRVARQQQVGIEIPAVSWGSRLRLGSSLLAAGAPEHHPGESASYGREYQMIKATTRSGIGHENGSFLYARASKFT